MSCNCGCNGGGSCNGMENIGGFQTGDTVPLQLKYMDEDGVIPIDEGYDVLVAFYDYKRNLITKGSISDGRLTFVDDHYEILIDHEESMKMIGKVVVEITVYKHDTSNVDHSDKLFSMAFDNRENNKLI